MTLNEFLKYVETGKPLKGDEIHQFMNEMSDEARRMTFELNGSYHDPEEIRERFHQRLLSFSRSWRGDTGRRLPDRA